MAAIGTERVITLLADHILERDQSVNKKKKNIFFFFLYFFFKEII
jgi:hypothetical protein